MCIQEFVKNSVDSAIKVWEVMKPEGWTSANRFLGDKNYRIAYVDKKIDSELISSLAIDMDFGVKTRSYDDGHWSIAFFPRCKNQVKKNLDWDRAKKFAVDLVKIFGPSFKFKISDRNGRTYIKLPVTATVEDAVVIAKNIAEFVNAHLDEIKTAIESAII